MQSISPHLCELCTLFASPTPFGINVAVLNTIFGIQLFFFGFRTRLSCLCTRSHSKFLFFQFTFGESDLSLVSEEDELTPPAKEVLKSTPPLGARSRRRERRDAGKDLKKGKYRDFCFTHSLVYTLGVLVNIVLPI